MANYYYINNEKDQLLDGIFYHDSYRYVPQIVKETWHRYYTMRKNDYFTNYKIQSELQNNIFKDIGDYEMKNTEMTLKIIQDQFPDTIKGYMKLNQVLGKELLGCYNKMLAILKNDINRIYNGSRANQ